MVQKFKSLKTNQVHFQSCASHIVKEVLAAVLCSTECHVLSLWESQREQETRKLSHLLSHLPLSTVGAVPGKSLEPGHKSALSHGRDAATCTVPCDHLGRCILAQNPRLTTDAAVLGLSFHGVCSASHPLPSTKRTLLGPSTP